MAYINDLYIHVVDEDVNDEVETSTHSVESGIDITDTIREKPITLSLTGKIVDYDYINSPAVPVSDYDNVEINGYSFAMQTNAATKKASEVLQRLKQFMHKGALIHFQGRNDIYPMQIKSISTSHPYTNAGGADFTMELQELRIANNSYVEPQNTEVPQEAALNDGGVQQVEKGDAQEVWHTTRSGDTVWGLVEAPSAPYKGLIRGEIDGVSYSAIDWVMQKNPSAFSVFGDFRTMQNGVNILVGYKE